MVILILQPMTRIYKKKQNGSKGEVKTLKVPSKMSEKIMILLYLKKYEKNNLTHYLVEIFSKMSLFLEFLNFM